MESGGSTDGSKEELNSKSDGKRLAEEPPEAKEKRKSFFDRIRLQRKSSDGPPEGGNEKDAKKRFSISAFMSKRKSGGGVSGSEIAPEERSSSSTAPPAAVVAAASSSEASGEAKAPEMKDTKSLPAEQAKAKSKGSSWLKMPSDITWPDPADPGLGTLPPEDFRNKRFKLLPMITDGPWIVTTAVRSCPALLGQKVVQRYFRGTGYFEVDVHVGSSVIASQIVGVCRGYAKNFTCDIGVIIQGEGQEELPEKLVCCLSISKLDVDMRRCIDDDYSDV